MSAHLPVILPLAAAVVYVAGVLLVKRASDFGVGVWRTTFVANLITALIFTLLLPLGGTFHLELLWQPALVAVFFVLGQWLNFLALQHGDVSVATPVLGVKIILVAVCTKLLLTSGVSAPLWIAAVLSSLAIALLNRSGSSSHRRVGLTILLASSTASMFAVFDVLVQKWSPAWGLGRFLPVMMGFTALFSFVFLPFFPSSLSTVKRSAWPWLLGGCAVIGVQAIMFIGCIAAYGGATTANVIYSSRGLWSVVGVWAVGHWFSNTEQHLDAAVLRSRLVGALLMMAAIALALK